MAERLKLRSHEAAELLGLSRRTIYRMAEDKRIPHYKVGGTLYFDRQELEDWIEGARVELRCAHGEMAGSRRLNMTQHTIPVVLTDTVTLAVTFEWDSTNPHEWEHVSAKPENDDADFMGWFQDDPRAMAVIDAEIERWATECRYTRYGDPMDLARERALEESA